MSNLAQIVARRADFDTCQVAAWTDGYPIIGLAGSGGVAAGPGNVGNGSLTLNAVAPGARRGAYLCTATALQAGIATYSVTDPDGDVIGAGATGLPLDAGGLRLTLAQGATPFAIGDTFALSVLTAPIDVTGLVFTLDARVSAAAATRMLKGASAPADGSQPSLLVDPTRGALSNWQRQPVMSRCPPGDYPYTVTATDPVADPDGDLPVIVFYGTIRHRAVLSPLPTS